jgi:hypothetical protein
MFEKINSEYLKKNYSVVASLWENMPEKQKEKYFGDYTMNEILSICYFELENYSQSIFHINKQLKFFSQNINSFTDDKKFYFIMKLEILNKQDAPFSAYKCVCEYFYLGGKDKKMIEYRSILEKKMLKKYNKLNSSFTTLYIFIIIFYFGIAYFIDIQFYSIFLTFFFIIGIFIIGIGYFLDGGKKIFVINKLLNTR